MLNYQTWLENTNVVRMLVFQAQVEVSGSTITRYFATNTVTIDAVEYLGIVKTPPSMQESINTDLGYSITFGDIEIVNHGGIRDTWLSDVWANKTVKIYVGEYKTGTLSLANDFELVFDGYIEDIGIRSPEVLNLKIRDKLYRMNYPVTETLLGNWYQGAVVSTATYDNQNKAKLKPLVFGEVNNISPLLVDPTLLEYMCHNGTVEQIIEVLDNGVPVQFVTTGSPTIPAGSFRLSQSPAGTITCSVQGDKRTVNISGATTGSTYTNTASNIISLILTAYGKGLSYSDLDVTSFTNLGSQSVGVYLNERANVLELCQSIAKSCGLTLQVTRGGKVKLVQIAIPTSSTATINESGILWNSLTVKELPPVVGSVKLGYAKNYTVLTGLVTGIPEQHKNLMATEYLEALQEDSAVKTKYSLMGEPTLEDTYLVDLTEATQVAAARLNLWKTPRKIFSMTCTSKYLSVEVGTSVTLTHSRFGLGSGVFGMVLSAKPDWLKGTIELEVLT